MRLGSIRVASLAEVDLIFRLLDYLFILESYWEDLGLQRLTIDLLQDL